MSDDDTDETGSSGQKPRRKMTPAQIARSILMPSMRLPWTVVLVAYPVSLIALLVAVSIPPRFRSSEVLLVQRNKALSLASAARQTLGTDDPTKSAGGLVLRRDNLIGLVRELNLIDAWRLSRPPFLGYLDHLRERLRGVDPEPEVTMAEILERRIKVSSGEDNTFTVEAEWPSPLARDIAVATRRRFVAAREAQDIAVIDAAIQLLEQQRDGAQTKLDEALNEIVKLSSRTKLAGAAASAGALRPAAPLVAWGPARGGGGADDLPTPGAGTDSMRAALQTRLAKTRDELRAATEPRRAAIADLERQLAEKKLSYAPEHPEILALERRLADAKSAPNPEADRLRAEERVLLDQLDRLEDQPMATPSSAGRRVPVAVAAPTASGPAPAAPGPAVPPPSETELETARQQLAAALTHIARFDDQLSVARMERVTVQAGYKYAFLIIWPADRAQRVGLNGLIFAPIGLLVGILLGMATAFVREFLAGRLVEPEQLEHGTGLALLGEVEL